MLKTLEICVKMEHRRFNNKNDLRMKFSKVLYGGPWGVLRGSWGSPGRSWGALWGSRGDLED